MLQKIAFLVVCLAVVGVYEVKADFNITNFTLSNFNCTLPNNTSPCLNGGIYANLSGSCQCYCPWSYYNSSTCNVLNPCWQYNVTCLNGGLPTMNEYRTNCSCTCPTGYTGSRCETYNPCYSASCYNGGTAYYSNGFCKCTCKSCYAGPLCQVYDPCQSACGSTINYSRCNNGFAQISAGTCKCRCLPYWEGTYCNVTNTNNTMGFGR